MAAKRVRLAQRRKAAGYSQEKLAERLGVEQGDAQSRFRRSSAL